MDFVKCEGFNYFYGLYVVFLMFIVVFWIDKKESIF